MSIIVRMVEGVGSAAFLTSCYAILANTFTNRVATVIVSYGKAPIIRSGMFFSLERSCNSSCTFQGNMPCLLHLLVKKMYFSLPLKFQ